MTTAKERIKKHRINQGLSRKEFAGLLGVNPSKIQDVETGKQRINEEFLILVSEKCNIDAGYLLTGKQQGESIFPQPIQGKVISQVDSDLVQIPQYEINLSAGYGAYPDDHSLAIGTRPFSLQWLTKKGLNASGLKLLRVLGDSMEPLLRDKDTVMIDTGNINPTEAMPFAVRLDGELLVKSIQRKGGGSFALVSRNKAYSDIEIDSNNPPKDFAIVGAVVWHAHSWV